MNNKEKMKKGDVVWERKLIMKVMFIKGAFPFWQMLRRSYI